MSTRVEPLVARTATRAGSEGLNEKGRSSEGEKATRRGRGLAERSSGPYLGQMSTRLLRELTLDEADVDSGERMRALSPAARVRLVAELTRAAWEGVGRERARFCRVYSYPGATSRALPRRGGVRARASRVRARDE